MRRSVRRASGRDQGDGPAQGRRAAPKLQRLREQRRREHFPRAEHEPEGFKAHTVGAAGKDLAQYVDDGGLVDGRAGFRRAGLGEGGVGAGRLVPRQPADGLHPGGTEQPERFGVFGAVPRGGNGLREPSGFAVVGGKFGRALIRAEQRLHGQEGHVHGRAPSRHSGEPDVPGSHALRG